MLAGRPIKRLDALVTTRFFSRVYTGLLYVVTLQRFGIIVTQITREQRARHIEPLGDVDQIVVVFPQKCCSSLQ